MFRWYEMSSRCYVFLADISVPSGPAKDPCLFGFKHSRWFTRGLTLQELLAPASVEFFTKEGQILGDRKSLTQEIHEVTAIPQSALQGTRLHHFSVEARLRWKGERKTKFVEDGAYSIAGLFSVYLAPIYGEGAELAYRRLSDEIQKTANCIRDIRLTDPRDDQKRIEATKGGLLKDSYRWILDNASFQQWQTQTPCPLLWIKGDPGKGKTMLLCGITKELTASCHNALISTFFCQAADSRLNNANAVLRGLLYLLVDQQPRLAYHVRKRYDAVGSRSLFEDANAWTVLQETFSQVLKDSRLPTTYLIVDALDECTTDLPKLLGLIAEQSYISPRVKWLVSSRNWPEIEQRLERANHHVRLSLELNSGFVAAAVDNFIRQKVLWLASLKKLDDMTCDFVLDHLLSNADNTFLWVSLVCQALHDTSKRHIRKKLESFPSGLSALYERMMQQIRGSDDAEVCTRMLATNTLVYRPLTVKELSALVEELDDSDIDTILELVGLCGSFLTLRDGTVFFVHQSAKDFLLDQMEGEIFPVGRHDVHHVIAVHSLDIMSRDLHRDMYDLKDPGHRFIFGKDLPPDPDPLAASRYSCVYWWDHLCESSQITSAVASIIKRFLIQMYLYWLEALSLCGHLRESVSSLLNKGQVVLQAILSADTTEEIDGSSSVDALIQDAHRFIMYHLPAVEAFPLQLYASALMFSPPSSLIRSHFQHEESGWYSINSSLNIRWSACLATLEHCGKTIAISEISGLLAFTRHGEVKILDMNSYTDLQTLQHHNVAYIAFSNEGTALATASRNGCIKIWDPSTGQCLTTFEEAIAGEKVNCMAFRPPLIAYASYFKKDGSPDAESSNNTKDNIANPGAIKVWDTAGEPRLIMLCGTGENEVFSKVVFSSDAMHLVSSSRNMIRIWNVSSGTCQKTLQGHTKHITDIKSAPTSALLASSSFDSTVKIWDLIGGTCVKTLVHKTADVVSIAFSKDSKMLASAAGRTVYLWDIAKGTCLQYLEGHTDDVCSLTFSHATRLVTASWDATLKVWDVASAGTNIPTEETYVGSDSIQHVAYSHNSELLATASEDGEIRIWSTEDGTCLHTLRDLGFIKQWIWSHSSQLVIGSAAGNIHIWDITRSEAVCSKTFRIKNHAMTAIAISHDCTKLAIRSVPEIKYPECIELWDLDRGLCVHMYEFDYDNDKYILNWSLVYSSDDLWLFTSSGALSTLPPYRFVSGQNREAALSASVPVGYTNSMWITYEGKKVLWVPPDFRPISYVAVRHSPDGQGKAIVTKSGSMWCIKFDPSKRPKVKA